MVGRKTVDRNFSVYAIVGTFFVVLLLTSGIFLIRNNSESNDGEVSSATSGSPENITASSLPQQQNTSATTIAPTESSSSTDTKKPDSTAEPSTKPKEEDPSKTSTQPKATAAPSNGKPVVHLTFDDGPSEITPYLLEVLEKHNVKATFFPWGEQLVENPEIGKQVVAKGHAIGNHSYTHESWKNPGGKEDMIKAQKTIEDILGVSPSCARSPFGDFDDQVTANLQSLGMKRWRWDLDPKEWNPGKEERYRAMLNQISSAQKVEGAEGVVILQHDSHESLTVLIDILDSWLEANGDNYQFKVIDGCLNYQ